MGKQASSEHRHERLCQDLITLGTRGLSPGWGALEVTRNVIFDEYLNRPMLEASPPLCWYQLGGSPSWFEGRLLPKWVRVWSEG